MPPADPVQRRIALLVAGCFFMENLDGTIVTTAAPRIGRALGVAPTSVGLVIAAYMVTVAVLIPLSGWMAERFGSRPVFLAAIVVFTAGSLACALSGSFGQLVVFRILQGAGGAMMVPVGRFVVLARTAKRDMLRITSLLVWPALLAPVIAPVAGGLITTGLGWRWLFGVNIPLGALALIVAGRIIPAGRSAAPPRLDGLGVVWTCSGLAAATYAAYELSEPRIPWASAAAFAAAAVVALVLAARHLARAAHPLVNLRPLRVATFRAALGAGTLFWTAITAVPFLLTLLFQAGFGWSPVKSGAVVLFVFVGNIAIKPATTPLLRRFGYRPVLIASTAGAAATMIAAAAITAGTPLVLIALIATLSGVGRSVGLTCYSTIAFADTPPDQIRDANTLQATAQQLAVGLGVPLGAIALRLGDAVSGGGTASAAPVAFGLCAAIALLATAGALRLHPGAGQAVTRPSLDRPDAVPGAAAAPEPR